MAWKYKKFISKSQVLTRLEVFCHRQNTWSQVKTWKISCLMYTGNFYLSHGTKMSYQWFNAKEMYLQCINNGITSFFPLSYQYWVAHGPWGTFHKSLFFIQNQYCALTLIFSNPKYEQVIDIKFGKCQHNCAVEKCKTLNSSHVLIWIIIKCYFQQMLITSEKLLVQWGWVQGAICLHTTYAQVAWSCHVCRAVC